MTTAPRPAGSTAAASTAAASMAAVPPDATATIEIDRPLDLVATLRPLWRGPADPTMRLSSRSVARACETPDGPGAIVVDLQRRADGGGAAPVVALGRAWGPGAGWLIDGLRGFIGLDDDNGGFDPSRHPVIARLARQRPGLRLGRTRLVFDALVPAVLEQKITGSEAFRGYRRLVLAHGTRAPGPTGLHAPPSAGVVAGLPSWSWPILGIEPRRGALLRRLAAEAPRLEAIASADLLAVRLRRFAGIGPWTAAEVTLRALGDPDAVSVADAHLSHLVGWNLAREPRASDERMLELLAPWAGHRARVIRLLESGGAAAPRYGPRVAPRDLRGL